MVEMTDQLEQTKRALYNAERRESRAKTTISKVLGNLRKQQLLSEESERLLAAFSHIPVELFTKQSVSYTEEQRQFATTLHFYSPKAYDFCRQTLQLPAASTLRRWLSGIDCQPGFSEQVFGMLKSKANGSDSWQYRCCAVMIDGMSIRKHLDWDEKRQKMIGYTDLGCGSLDSDAEEEATEALVIMAVGITGHWKVTLGYVLVAGISAVAQAQLIRTAFVKLHEIGIRGIALIMDGHATNQAMVNELGGCLSPNNLKTVFEHPSVSKQLVYIFFDACHVLKLLRNCLEAMQQIIIPGTGTARWSDIVRLHELQHVEGLRAANKLSTAHIQFQQQKMKVRLAAQTLSASVGKALQFLEANKITGFTDTCGTQYFIFHIDRLFDIFNSRSPRCTGYKQALTPSVFKSVLPFLNECRTLLLTMTDTTGKKVCEGRRHMAALGFVVGIDSLMAIGQEVLLSADSPYCQRYLLTYKFSQDHLELFFSSVRRRGGWNNNPSAKQFAYAYRALLNRASVTASNVANVLQQDNTDLLHLSQPAEQTVEPFVPTNFNIDHDYCTVQHLSLFVSNVVEYISGWVARKLTPKIACADCLGALVTTADKKQKTSSLIEIKNNGGLVKPAESLVRVVQEAEKVLREMVNIHHVRKEDYWDYHLETRVLERIPSDVFSNGDMAEHFQNSLHGIDSHYTDLIRNICRVYIRMRRFHAINLTNQRLHGRSVRQSLTKTILFKNQ